MTITRTMDGTKVTLAVDGRLETITAPQLEAEVKALLPQTTEMVIDFTNVVYCSSAGLRVLLFAHKSMAAKGGKLIVKGANETVTQVFDATGLTSVLNLQ